MKIDVFCHIFPQTFFDKMLTISAKGAHMQKRMRNIPSIVDLDVRFRMMDQFEDYRQVISLGAPPIEALGDTAIACDMAKLANDGMAELVTKYTDRFPNFIASLPLNDPEGACAEAERAILELGATGVQIFTNMNGKPMDDPAYTPLFDLMAKFDLPIWMHPARPASFPDYIGEQTSKYEMWWVFGWPYETSVAMARLIFAGCFDKHPNLKIITHHGGGMVPFFEGRVGPGMDQLGSRTDDNEATTRLVRGMKKRPIDYFRMYYADTATFGSQGALECSYKFFGVDRMLFASDSPFDPEKGPGFIRETIRALEAMDLTDAQRKQIYEDNARKMLRLKLS